MSDPVKGDVVKWEKYDFDLMEAHRVLVNARYTAPYSDIQMAKDPEQGEPYYLFLYRDQTLFRGVELGYGSEHPRQVPSLGVGQASDSLPLVS